MEARIGLVGILANNNNGRRPINNILNEYSGGYCRTHGDIAREKDVAVISLIVDGNTDDIGALTGKLVIFPL